MCCLPTFCVDFWVSSGVSALGGVVFTPQSAEAIYTYTSSSQVAPSVSSEPGTQPWSCPACSEKPAQPHDVISSSSGLTPAWPARPSHPLPPVTDTHKHQVTGSSQVIPPANPAVQTGSKLLVKNPVLVLSVLWCPPSLSAANEGADHL